MSFGGFSEDDIKKLSKTSEKADTTIKKTQLKAKKSSPNAARQKKPASSNNALPKLLEIPENEQINDSSAKLTQNGCNNDNSAIIDDKSTLNNNQSLGKSNDAAFSGGNACEKKFKSIEEFEAKQKLIEEQNRKRKELLAKALADRTKQTQEEAARLEKIQEEFKKLDAILSNDVKILRKQIEVATIEYNEAEKRYHKIEKEFLESKILLHQKLEKKEMLTEHLCAIIEKNEERKADKLIELLHQLHIDPQKEKENSN